MASTYSDLKFELIGTGDQAGTWGATTNTNLGTAIQQAITGTVDVAFSSADVTLTLTDTNAAQNARALRLNLTGTSGGARNLIVPAIAKQYIVNNGLADAVTVKNSSGTGIAVAAGKTMLVFNNATNVVDVTNYLSSLALGTALPVASGGTGVTTSTGTGAVVLSNTPTLVTPILGTPTSGTLSSCTGLPISTGVSGLGTNVATALAVNIGSSGAAVVNGGVLGTPSSGTLSGCTVDGTDGVGFRNVPINSQSAAYTTVLADAGKVIFHPSTDANARTFTIDSNANVAYPVGTAITFINMTANVVTIAITSDTMYLAGTGTTGSRSLANYGLATAVKMTSTTWIISGNGLT
jgi:hypothetical protein